MGEDKDFINSEKNYQKKTQKAWNVVLLGVPLVAAVSAFFIYFNKSENISFKKEIEIADPASGASKVEIFVNNNIIESPDTLLAEGKGVEIVRANCTPCHSARLIVQNRATREGWLSMIRWMQQTQNLWDLGPNEDIILDYLSTHYPPEEKGRRENLSNIEWYILE